MTRIRRQSRTALIEPGVSLFAYLLRRARSSKAVSDPLRHPTLDVQALRQMRGVKPTRQIVGDDLHQVAGRAKPYRSVQRDELLIFHDVVCVPAPAPASVAGIAPFLDLDQRRFDTQIAMRKHAREVDEFVEEVDVTAALRAQPAADHTASLRVLFYQPLSNDDRFDDQHSMIS